MGNAVRNQRKGFLIADRLEQRVLLSTAIPGVSGVTLINAGTNSPVSGIVLTPGATIDLGQVGHSLNIRADLAPGASVGSVRFNYDGNPDYKIENFAPYDIGGDSRNGRDFLPWLPVVGTHTLVVTPYPQPGGTGQAGVPYLLLFNVIDSSAPARPIRVNAGGGVYTNTAAETFSSDSGFVGGNKVFSNVPIAGTSDRLLYDSRREGREFFFTQRLQNDTYVLTLYFADPGSPSVHGAPGVSNVFDVSANGSTLLDHFNITASAGTRTAVQKTFIVSVTDGRIALDFHADRGEAMVSALSIVPQRVPLVESPLYVNAGGLSFTDSLGRTFQSAIGFTGGTTSTAPWPVANTNDQPTFFSYRTGSQFSFSQPVADGDYELWLEMADPTFTEPGQRLFNVTANGTSLLNRYDIVADAGPEQADVKAFDIHVTGGKLDLSFTGVVGDAIISSIVLIPKDTPASALPYVPQSLPDNLKMIVDERNLAQLGLDMLMYANGHPRNGQIFPPSLPALVNFAEIDPQVLISPRTSTLLPRGEISFNEEIAWSATLNDYIYNGAGKNVTVDSTFPLAWDNPDLVTGDINILFGDGHVGIFSRAAASQVIGQPIADPTHALLPFVPPAPDPRVLLSQLNLRIIALGADDFANNSVRNGLSLPPDFGNIAQFESVPLDVFLNPRGPTPPPPADLVTGPQIAAWVDSTTDYLYVGFHKTLTMPPTALVAFENPAAMPGGINLLRGDFQPQFREMRWAIESILADRAQFPTSGA